MSVIGGQNPIVQDGLVYILDFGNERSYTSGSNSAQSLIYNPVTASFTAPPAGDYSGLAAAYSVRRVVSSYSGPAMEVQSGSVSASIGFDSFGNLDTASLEAFAGSGDAFVKTWYDQSGNGRHASQAVTSSQPQIVSGGSVVLENGKPTLQFDGVNDNLISNSFTAISQPFTTFSVNKWITTNNAAGLQAPFIFDLGTDRSLQIVTAPNKYYVYFGQYLISTQGANFSNYQLHYVLAKSTTSEIKIDSESIISGNLGTGTASRITIGSRGGSAYFSNQFFSEFIFYSSDQSSNRTSIESNINSYYNIYTSSFSPTPGFDTNKIDLSKTVAVDTNQSFPGFSYDQGNLTLIFTGETKTNSPLFSQADQISVVGTTSSIGYGLPGNNGGRTFPASGFDHISLRFTTGSVDCFVNGIPTAPNSIFPTGSFGTGDFIASNYSGSLGNLLVYNRELTDDEIYDTYLQQARRYSLPETPKPYSVDSSVYTYTQAAGITGSSIITALDAFVSGLKANNLWNKMIAIYPFLGSDTVKTRYNLKDPSLNTTAITYSGSWSSSDSGSYNNNTSSYGILENIKGDYYHPLISSESIHLSYLSYDTPASGGYLMGTEEIPGLPGDIAAPAAAYSVRKVRTAYTGSAMEVRRDFDDVTFDVGFDGSGNLDTGSLLTNMTASGITAALPGDYSGLAAAYSLRKVSSSYSGYAVEVRRAVDNYSASIGFDGSGNLNTASLASFIRTGSETPIDTYSGLAAAYSLRKVVPTYGGDAIEIQSGSVSQSIGFDSFGDLDVAAIKSFAGSGDAFVKTWYDQSGNGYHATQSVVAAQPQIVNAGSVVLENGSTALSFDGVDDVFTATLPSVLPQPNTIIVVHRYNDSSDVNHDLIDSYPNSNRTLIDTAGNIYRLFAGTVASSPFTSTTSQTLLAALFSGSSSELSINGVNQTSLSAGTLGLDSFTIGTTSTGDRFLNGNIQEILIYNSDQSANRTYIENNINSYYGIYTPDSVSTEDAYVKTWYDQSGNGNHASQTTASSQPQIVSGGSVILENGKPCVQFDGTDDGMDTPSMPFISSSIYVTANIQSPRGRLLSGVPGNSFFWFSGGTSANLIEINYAGGPFTTGSNITYINNQSLLNFNSNNSSYNLYIDTVKDIEQVETVNNFNISHIGYNGEDQWTKLNLQELTIYNSDQSTNRGLIEDNINGYYNIFTHTLESGSGYVSKWYDQSGNDNHATQSVAANQPLILSSGSIITEGGKSALSFDGDGDFLSIASLTNTNSNSVFQVLKTEPHEGINAEFPFNFNGDRVYYTQSPVNNFQMASNVGNYNITGMDTLNLVLNSMFYSSNGSIYQNGILKGSSLSFSPSVGTFTGYIGSYTDNRPDLSSRMKTHELLYYTSSQINTRAPIEQNINNYFNIYYQPYNLNTNSLSLFSSPTVVVGAANNVASASFTTGGPLGLITVSRTGSSDYTLWKNRVPNKVTLGASTPLSNELYLNAANADNSLFSGSQNNISFASVGAGLTDDEVYTYYELVDDLQTSLNRGVQDPDAFITTWDTRITGTGTVTNTSSIALSLYGTQAITASWGDGTVSLISQSYQVDKTHSYAEPGIYTVSITGQGQGFQFGNGGDRAKLIDIVQWGSISGSTTSGFSGCFNLIGTAADPHVLQTTNINDYFLNATKFNGYINNWDVSKVTSLTQTFAYSLTSFNQPLDNWDTSNVTSMNITFTGANKFNQNIGSWNTGNVTTTLAMFSNASAFNNGESPSINNWNTSKVTNMYQMFSGASRFNQPIGSWDTSNVTNMAYMFENSPFNQNIGSWNVEKVSAAQGMYQMFYNATAFNNGGSPDINNWRPISCSNFSQMFYGATAFNQPIGNWPLSASNMNMSNMFRNADAFNQNIGAWNVEKVTNMGGMFQDNSGFNNSGSSDINNWRPISCSNFSSMFYNAPAFNQPIGNWTLGTGSQIPATGINMSSMFRSPTSFNQNIGAWNVEKVTNMSSMFQQNSVFNNSGSSDINNWRPISCSNFSNMFDSATAFNQPIGNWPLSASNINMSNMFRNADAFNQNIGAWDTSAVTNMSYMFFLNNGFNQNIGSWNVSNVSDFTGMFRASSFNNSGSSDINNWQLKSTGTISLSLMFSNSNFNQNISSWNTERVTNMSSMFLNNSSFNQNISSWNTSTVTDMSTMFQSAPSFNQNIGNWDISNVTTMTNMLNNSGIDIPNYTKTLRGWGDLANSTGVQTAVPLGAPGKKYGAAHAQRKVLTDTYGWTITDGGQEPFVFTINTTASGYNPGSELTFTLPLTQNTLGSYGLDILVDWGDGQTSTISQSAQVDKTHTYSNSGSYEITITGSLFGFNFNNGGDKAKLTDVKKWSAFESSTTSTFYGCSNLSGSATDSPFISNTSLISYFQNCSSFNGAIGSWDVSSVTRLDNMLSAALLFNKPINSWNTSNITSFYFLFSSAIAFNQDIGSWDVSNSSNFEGMFYNARNFNNGNSDNIKNWVFSTTKDITFFNMFHGNTTSTTPLFNQPIGNWNTQRVTNMGNMFRNNLAFNQDIGNWNVSSVANFTGFMENKSTADYSHLDSIYNNWPNYKLKPNLTASFGSIEYTTAASESRNLLTRPYASASITNLQDNGGNYQVTANSHGLLAGNRLTITGSDNAVLNKAHTVVSVPDPNSFIISVPYTASSTTGAFIYTGYNWNITDGGLL